MLTADQIDALGHKAQQITEPITEFLIRDIARRISEAGQLTSTASYQVWKLQKLGVSQRQIKKELRRLLKVSHRELRNLLTQSAEVGYNFDIKNLPFVQAVPFRKNTVIQEIVDAAVQMAREDLSNMVQTMGFVGPNGKALPLTQAYEQACDFAFQKVATGAQDYNSAIRQATKELANRGIVTIDYASGRTRSLEAAVRGNIMGAIGTMQEKISQQNHDDFGCNGWEISAHANSAPDHEPIQGRQYPDEEYIQLNDSLVRRIGTLNCGHSAFPIIIGVNSPQYTREQLEKFRKDNEKGFTYEGKHYTGYEATQRQRKLERAIRRQKHRILIDEAAGDKERLAIDQTKLVRLNDEYARFTKAAGLRSQRERMNIPGFGTKEANTTNAAAKAIEKQANLMYDIGSTEQNGNAWLRDRPIRRKIGTEQYPLTLHQGRQNKHIPGTNEYKQYAANLARKGQYGPPYLTVDSETIRDLVAQYHGTGILVKTKDGKWREIERITMHPDKIGVAVNNLTGKEVDTTTFTIRYSKDGVHIAPDYPSRKGDKATE